MPLIERGLKAALSLCLILLSAYAAFFVYAQWCRSTWRDVPAAMRRSRVIRRLFMDPAYDRLMRAVSSTGSDAFDTMQDFDAGVALSRRIYLPTEMFGLLRYRHRPRTAIYNAVVWSGLQRQSIELERTAETRALLEAASVIRSMWFETDDHGFKPTGDPRPVGVGTVLFLGDSFTEGVWTAPAETFVGRYSQKLRETRRPEVAVNSGVDGYSALEEHWMLEHFGDELRPRLVVVNLFPNDVGADYIAVIRGEGNRDASYAEMFHHLDAMRELAARGKAAFVVAVIPAKEQLGALRDCDAFQHRVRQWCELAGVRFVDPRSDLQALGADVAYLSWDPHFTVAGHERYASILFRETADLLSQPRDVKPSS